MLTKKAILTCTILSLGLGLSACSRSKNNDAVNETNKKMAELNDEQKRKQEEENKKRLNGEIGDDIPEDERAVLTPVKKEDFEPLVNEFCLNVTGKKEVASSGLVKMGNEVAYKWLSIIHYLGQSFPNLTCEAPSLVYNDKLVAIYSVPAKITEDTTIYITLAFSFSQIDQLLNADLGMLTSPLTVQHNMVPMRDGLSMSTYTLSTTQEKSGAVYLKTPYLQSSGTGMYVSYLGQFLVDGQHVILQANRGTELSQGEFGWLSPQEVEDSYDTLSWWSQSEKSNGKVLAYGVSYDGFNALATVSGAHPSLVAGFSCSAPVAAATDSITAGYVANIGVLDYVANRKGLVTYDQLSIRVRKLIDSKQDLVFEKLDEHLFGGDSREWNELLSSSRQSGAGYWKERDLLPYIINAKVPVFHFTGLVNDQDGRDPLLMFRRLQEKLGAKSNHYMSIHPAGHGCGPSFEETTAFKYVMGALKGETLPLPQNSVMQYQFTSRGYLSSDTLSVPGFSQVESQLLGPDSKEIKSIDIVDGPTLMSEEELKDTYNYLTVPVSSEMIVNGMIKLKLSIDNKIPNSAINVGILGAAPIVEKAVISEINKPNQLLPLLGAIRFPEAGEVSLEEKSDKKASEQRYQAFSFGFLHWLISQANTIALKDTGPQMVEFEFLPTLQKVPAGSILYIGISTRPNVVDTVAARSEFLTRSPKEKVTINVKDSSLILPVEGAVSTAGNANGNILEQIARAVQNFFPSAPY